MDVAAVEHAIIERLKAQVGQAEVAPFPATQNGELPPLKAHSGEVLVRWLGATLPVPVLDGSEIIRQDATEQFETLIRVRNHSARDKNPHADAYALLALVVAALKGYSLPDLAEATFLYRVREQFLDELEGIWTYSILWQFTVPEITTP